MRREKRERERREREREREIVHALQYLVPQLVRLPAPLREREREERSERERERLKETSSHQMRVII